MYFYSCVKFNNAFEQSFCKKWISPIFVSSQHFLELVKNLDLISVCKDCSFELGLIWRSFSHEFAWWNDKLNLFVYPLKIVIIVTITNIVSKHLSIPTIMTSGKFIYNLYHVEVRICFRWWGYKGVFSGIFPGHHNGCQIASQYIRVYIFKYCIWIG